MGAKMLDISNLKVYFGSWFPRVPSKTPWPQVLGGVIYLMVARKLVVRQERCREETCIKDTPIPVSQVPPPRVSTTVSASRGLSV